MTKKQLIRVFLGIFFISCFCLTVYATNNRHGDSIKRGHNPDPTCKECHTSDDSSCGRCHTMHYNKCLNLTQAELDAQINMAVEQAVEQAESAIITKYDPNKDGHIGLSEVIYYLQVIAKQKD